jgi:hypothetical protein
MLKIEILLKSLRTGGKDAYRFLIPAFCGKIKSITS